MILTANLGPGQSGRALFYLRSTLLSRIFPGMAIAGAFEVMDFDENVDGGGVVILRHCATDKEYEIAIPPGADALRCILSVGTTFEGSLEDAYVC